MESVAKAKFALWAKITALHIKLAFEGKGVGVKSGVILEGQTPALNTKQTNNRVNMTFGRMGLTLPS
jgi:hypothetical protein